MAITFNSHPPEMSADIFWHNNYAWPHILRQAMRCSGRAAFPKSRHSCEHSAYPRGPLQDPRGRFGLQNYLLAFHKSERSFARRLPYATLKKQHLTTFLLARLRGQTTQRTPCLCGFKRINMQRANLDNGNDNKTTLLTPIPQKGAIVAT